MIDKLYENMLNADRKPFSKRLDRESLVRNVFESSIDFAREDLDSAIWIKKDAIYILRTEVKEKILNLLEKYPDVPLLEIAEEIRILGSMCSNLYTEEADIDVHIVPKDVSKWNDEKQKAVKVWFENNIQRLDAFVDKHVIEIFVQLNSHIDFLSDGVYNVRKNSWEKGPRIVPLDYNPYDDFSHVGDDVKNAVQGTDIIMGELKRDAIDYVTVCGVLPKLPKEVQVKLQLSLKSKLEDIEKDIKSLHLQRKAWVELRRLGNKPIKSMEDLKNSKLVNNWKDMNAVFKFIARYQYMTVIKDLEKLLFDDERITSDEIPIIKDIMGVK